MITIPANDAIGIGHVFKEATGFVIFPCKGRIKTFQIHPDYGAFVVIVKDGVLDNAGSQHEIVSGGSSKRINTFPGDSFPLSPKKHLGAFSHKRHKRFL